MVKFIGEMRSKCVAGGCVCFGLMLAVSVKI